MVSIGRVRVHYSILQLLKGNYKNAVSEIGIIKSGFIIDTDKDRDLIDFIKELGKGESTGKSYFPDIILSGRNLDITIKNKDSEVKLTRLFFKLNSKSGEISFSSRGKAGIKKSNSIAGISYLNSRFQITAVTDKELHDINSRISLRSIRTDLFSLRSLSLQIKRNKESLVVRKIEDSSPLDMEMNYYFRNKEVDLGIISENFIPSRYFHSSVNSSFTEWLGNSYTANFKIGYFLDSKAITYDGSVESSGSAKILGGKYRLKTKLKGDSKTAYVEIADLRSSYGRFIYKGRFNVYEKLPGGSLEIRGGRYGKMFVNTNLSFKNDGNKVFINSRKMEINGISLRSFSGKVTKYAYDVDFSSSFSIAGNYSFNNSVNIEGNLQMSPKKDLQLRISAKDVPLSPFNRYSARIDTSGITASFDGFATTDFSTFSYSILNTDIRKLGNKKNSIRFNVSGNNDSLSITSIVANWDNEEAAGKLFVMKKKDEYTVNGDLSLNSYPFRFIAHAGKDGIFINGDYDFTLAVFLSDTGTNFILKTSAFPVPLNNNVSEVTLNCSGYFLNSLNWKIFFNNALVSNLPLPVPENTISFSGEVTQDELTLKSIMFKDPMSVLYGEGYFSYDLQNKRITGNLNMTDDKNTEYYSSTVSIYGNSLDIYADFAGAPVERFKKSSLSGLLTGNIAITGDRGNPSVDLSVDLENGLLKSVPFKLSTALNYSGNKLDINSLSMKYRGHEIKKGSGFIDADNGNFSFSIDYNGIIGGHTVKSSPGFNGKISIPGTVNKKPLSEIVMLPFKGTFYVKDSFIDGKKTKDWSVLISRSGNMSINFEGGPDNGLNGFIDSNGNFRIISSEGIPVRTTATGYYRDGKILISMKDLAVDMKIINIVKITGFSFTGGTAYGNLEIKGSAKDPEFYGSLDVKKAKMALSYLPDMIEPFNTSVTVEGRNVLVKPVDIMSGTSKVTAKASFFINRWITSTFNLEFITTGDQDLHFFYKIPSVGLGIDGFVNGNMFIRGKDGLVDMGGDIRVDDCIITLSQKGGGEETLIPDNLKLNMNFTTGKKVEMLWPSANVPIIKAYTEPGQHLNVTLDGPAGTYRIKGDIGVKYGEIYYFQRNFYITSGTIIFNETEESFDPLVDFKAQIREVDSKGEVVNVYMYLDKTPLSKFAPRFESDPPLSTVEIMSMLGSNVFAQLGTEKIDVSSALMLTGDLVSQFGIIRGFEQKVKGIFKLDLFSIRTQMIQNIILDRFLNNDINDDTSSDLFGKYLDNTTIYLGKYFGNTLFLQTMIQVGTYTDFTSDYVSGGTLQVQTKVNLEWKTPLFLLDFSVEPDFVDPISSINNTSLSFSWGFSY